MSRRVRIAASLVFLSPIFVSSPALAETVFYVDPDWQGSATGSAAAPWRSLDSSAWGTINGALAAADVTIYFSSRAASSDTHQTTTTPLYINRTDTTTHRLTFDGMSQYNTNDASPSWAPYSGSSRFTINTAYPLSTNNHGTPPFSVERNYWTLRGFRSHPVDGQCLLMEFIRNVIVEDNEFFSSPGATSGGCISLGQGANITIRRNTIHDTFGEGIYIGGWYSGPPNMWLVGTGIGQGPDPTNAHGDNLLIEGNTIYDVGKQGEEGDAIDLKDGWTTVVIRNNTIYSTIAGGAADGGIAQNRDGITMNSAALVEGNLVYNKGRVGIAMAAQYDGSGDPTRTSGWWAGMVIRNNVVVNCGRNALYSHGEGISNIGDGTLFFFVTPQIYNNTVYGTREKVGAPGNGRGIFLDATVKSTYSVFNNIVAATEGIDFEAPAGRLDTHGNNAYWHAGVTVAKYGSNTYTVATITTFEGNSLSLDPLFLAVGPPYIRTNFALQSISALCGKNMGAIPCLSGISPQPPTNLRVQ